MDSLILGKNYFAVIDYFVFGFLLLCSTLIGIYFGFFAKQKQNTTEEYLMGGKNMGIFPISMSLIASLVSGTALMIFPAEIYVYGSQYSMLVLGHLIANFIMMVIYLPLFYKLQITSSYEYLKLRFGEPVRFLASVLFLVKMFIYNPIVIYIPALAFNQVTGINVHVITSIACLVCIFYTTVGGFKAVVWTDTLQTVLMFGGVATVMILGTIKVGGFDEVLERSRKTDRLEFFNLDFDPTLRLTLWAVTIGEMSFYFSMCAVNQAMIQRCLALRSLRRAIYSLLILTVGKFCIMAMTCYTGLVIYAFFHGCDPISTKMISKAEQLLSVFAVKISESLPGLPGLFIAGIFSAALSSLSTSMNSTSGIILQDMIKPFLKRPITEQTASRILKVVAALFGVICVGLVFLVEKASSVLQMSTTLSAIPSGALLGVFTLGMFFPWANSIGAICGCVTSILLIVWMSVGSQTALKKRRLIEEPKAVFTDQCPEGFFNQTSLPLPTEDFQEDVFYLYRISNLYYVLIGTITVIVVGMAVSFATGFRDPREVNRDLLTPVIHRFLPKQPVLPEEQKMTEQRLESIPLNGCQKSV